MFPSGESCCDECAFDLGSCTRCGRRCWDLLDGDEPCLPGPRCITCALPPQDPPAELCAFAVPFKERMQLCCDKVKEHFPACSNAQEMGGKLCLRLERVAWHFAQLDGALVAGPHHRKQALDLILDVQLFEPQAQAQTELGLASGGRDESLAEAPTRRGAKSPPKRLKPSTSKGSNVATDRASPLHRKQAQAKPVRSSQSNLIRLGQPSPSAAPRQGKRSKAADASGVNGMDENDVDNEDDDGNEDNANEDEKEFKVECDLVLVDGKHLIGLHLILIDAEPHVIRSDLKTQLETQLEDCSSCSLYAKLCQLEKGKKRGMQSTLHGLAKPERLPPDIFKALKQEGVVPRPTVRLFRLRDLEPDLQSWSRGGGGYFE